MKDSGKAASGQNRTPQAADLFAILEGVPMQGICGMDEAGRGPLAGPVSAAAVILPSDFDTGILDDSKAMSATARERAYEAIIKEACDWAIGFSTVGEIGSMNILGASLLAMRRAFACLILRPEIVLVDGNRLPWHDDALPPLHAIVKGDGLVPSIMAASILAKVARDRVMDRLDVIEPEYGFARHRGYPTLAHRLAIKKNGPSLWARPGFRLHDDG